MLRWLMAVGVVAGQGFERDLQPVFRQHCYGCHASNVKMGSLDVETHEGLLRGGNQGTILVPGNAAESRLYLTLAGKMEPAMPMGGKRLSDAELEVVRKWIDSGARPDPGGVAWRAGVIASGWGGELRLTDEAGRLLRKIVANVGNIRTVSLSPDGKFVAAGGAAMVRVFEVATGREVIGLEMTGVASPALSGDGRRRAVQLPDGSVRIEDIR